MRSFCKWVWVTVASVCLLGLTGCLSDSVGSGSLAYVEVRSGTTAELRMGVLRVFQDDGYRLVTESGGSMIFEREATQRDQVMYGRYQEPLTMRVVVSIEPRRQGGCLVRADAYAMHDRDETKVMRIARRPYQEMLNRVKANQVTARGGE